MQNTTFPRFEPQYDIRQNQKQQRKGIRQFASSNQGSKTVLGQQN
jgi:hypothetical protein